MHLPIPQPSKSSTATIHLSSRRTSNKGRVAPTKGTSRTQPLSTVPHLARSRTRRPPYWPVRFIYRGTTIISITNNKAIDTKMSRYRKRSYKASYNDDVAPAEEDEDEPESPSARRRRIYGSASSSDDDDRTFVLPASPVAPAGRGRGNPARGGRGNAGRRNNVPDDDGPIDIGGTPPPSGAERGRGNAPRPRPARRTRGNPSLGREPVFPNQNYRPADDDEDDDNGDDEVVYMGTAAELAANASIPANVRNGRQREERLMNMINSDVPPRTLASRPAPRVPRAAVAMAATATYPPLGFFPAPMGVLNQATATPVDSQRNARGRLEDRRLYWNNSSIMVCVFLPFFALVKVLPMRIYREKCLCWQKR